MNASSILRKAAPSTGVFALSRMLTRRHPRILMYHKFGGTDASRDRTSALMFRRQLEHIRRHYEPIRLADLATRLAEPDDLAPNSVVVTVDDGHTNFLRYGVPLLREFQIPATLFVVSNPASTGEWLWEDRWIYLRACAPAAVATFRPRHPLRELRALADDERESYLADLARHTGTEVPATPPADYAIATWEDLRQLTTDDLFDVGSHSRSHRILSRLSREDAWSEIDGSRRDIESNLNTKVSSFCYPSGGRADYRPEHLDMVRKAGYTCATAAHFGHVAQESNRFALPRMGGVFGDMIRFRRELDGFESMRMRILGESPNRPRT